VRHDTACSRAHRPVARAGKHDAADPLSTALYAELEADTGLATGWKQCGSLSVARTAERTTQIKRTAAVARAYGVACDVTSPKEAGDLWPVMRTDDLPRVGP
jgi:glycine/D-amino acid oxidase-like deaminating enzyme